MSKHDEVANQLAKKSGVEYNRGKGPDVNSSAKAIEVETVNTVREGLRQLQGFRKPVYIAGATKAAVEEALRHTAGTTVGVMDERGKILKRSTRRQ